MLSSLRDPVASSRVFFRSGGRTPISLLAATNSGIAGIDTSGDVYEADFNAVCVTFYFYF